MFILILKMEDLLGYKLAYACWVLKEQKTIDEVILEIKKTMFSPYWHRLYGTVEIKCHPFMTAVTFPSGEKQKFDNLNMLGIDGFAITRNDADLITLDFSHWTNMIMLEKLKTELKKELTLELVHELVQEVFKPEGFGQKLAEEEFKNLSQK